MILNLGCGGKTSPRCVNIDRNIHLRIARNPILYPIALKVLSESRAQHLRSLKTNIQLHDLRKGVPYPDNSVDAVYHSHVLEHIDRNLFDGAHDPARLFLAECRRVLKPGGVLRIVVPDLELSAKRYLAALERYESGAGSADEVEGAVDVILGQAVRKEADGTRRQQPGVRWLENKILGSARDRGETHQWEYDGVTLAALLKSAGFMEVVRQNYATSRIADWNEIGLDLEVGEEYKPGSLYMEAIK